MEAHASATLHLLEVCLHVNPALRTNCRRVAHVLALCNASQLVVRRTSYVVLSVR